MSAKTLPPFSSPAFQQLFERLIGHEIDRVDRILAKAGLIPDLPRITDDELDAVLHPDFDDDPLCAICHQPESQHALVDSWCAAKNNDQIWSTTKKFTKEN